MGSNLITRIVMFSIFINLSIGVIVYGVLDAHENQIFDFTITHEYLLDGQSYGDDFQSELEKSVHPSGMLDDKSDQIYRILDTISLGFVYRFISIVDDYMFGLVNLLDNLVGQYMNPNLRGLLFGNHNNDDLIPNSYGILKFLISIAYMMFGIQLLTGKDVTK